jgi:predicted site-specific integrase-resolvase
MLSSKQVAKSLGLTGATLSRYISAGKITAPKTASSGGMTIYLWTEEDVERVRKLLPKIANGRKTRYKKQSVLSNQQSAKTERAQAGAPTLQKKRKPQKKK